MTLSSLLCQAIPREHMLLIKHLGKRSALESKDSFVESERDGPLEWLSTFD